MKKINLGDILTEKQIKAAYKLYKKSPPGSFAKTCADEIVSPNIKEINKKLGQKNDPLFLAYLCEYAFMGM